MDPIEFIDEHRKNKAKIKKQFLIRFIIFIVIISIVFLIVKKIYSLPPKLIFECNNNKSIAILNGYNWKFLMFDNNKNDVILENEDYDEKNILKLSSGDEIYFTNLRRKNMKSINISYYNMDLGSYKLKSDEIDAQESNIYITAPEEIGTYIYNFNIEYKDNGRANYILKVIVTQDIEELKKYENCSDKKQIENLINILPYGKFLNNFYINNSVLNIKYQDINCGEDNFVFNNIVLFTCVNNIDTIIYNINDNNIVIKKSSIQNISELNFDAINNYINKRVEIIKENVNNNKFKAIVEEINERSIIVKIDESEEASKTIDRLTLPVDNADEFLIGDEVEVVYTGDLLDKDGIYLENIEKIHSDLDVSLESISIQYTKEQAIEDGYYIYTNTGKEYNENKFEEFIDDVSNKKTSSIRIITFNINGDLIINDISYEEDKFYVCIDNRRNSLLKNEEKTFKNLEYQYLDSSDIEDYENHISTIENVMFLTVHNNAKFYLY